MKKYLVTAVATVSLFMPTFVFADMLVCPEGEQVVSVQISAGSPEIPEVTHQQFVPGYFSGSWPHFVWHPAHFETIVDSPAVPAVPAVFEDQCQADPDYVPPVVSTSDVPKKHKGGGGYMGPAYYGFTSEADKARFANYDERQKMLGQWRFRMCQEYGFACGK